MAGRHAAKGMGDFIKGLTLFILKWFMFGVIVFLVIYTVIVKVPDWFPSEGEPEAQPVVTSVATSTTTAEPAITTTSTTSTSTTTPTSTDPVLPTTTSQPAPTTTVTTTSVVLAPSEITVRVLNSTSRSGLAAAVTQNLAALGYQMLEQGNYSPSLSTTTIFYNAGFDEAGAALAGELPGAVSVQPNPAASPSADLLVVLGASYP